jgi:16S rRNA (uracil1498-N3)-methyltransferase
MRRFYIDDPRKINDDTVRITGDEAGHILRVLRLKKNDCLILFDQQGNIYKGFIVATNRNEVKVKITEKQRKDASVKTGIILCQAIIRPKKMDFIVQKSTELGVSGIIPFYSSRSIPRWENAKAAGKVAHWQKIVAASIKQSGIRQVPVVENITDFSELIEKDFKGYTKLILWENESQQNLKNIFSAGGVPEKMLFAVGPEGGFSEDEILKAKQRGFVIVGLGKNILRSETAPIALLAIIRYERGDLG